METVTEPLILNPDAPQGTRIANLKQLCRVTIEPVVVLLIFAANFSSVVSQIQIIYLTCTVSYGYNETICEQLGTTDPSEESQEVERIIQPYVAKIVMVSTLAGTIGPAITGIFFGAWSDKFGRKPLLLICTTGFFISATMTAFFTFLSTITPFNPWLYILTSIPTTLVGGYCSLLSGTYCHLVDTTSEKQRPFKLAMFGAFISLGLFLGSLASGYAYEATNTTTVFTISALITLIAVIYLKLFVNESLDSEKLQTTSKFKGLFQLALVKEMIQTLVRQRPNYDRMITWTCIATLCVGLFALEGSATIFYLYVRENFLWSPVYYTTYNAMCTLCGAVGATLAIIVFQKVFKVSEVTIILIGLGSQVLDSVVKTVATKSWHLYFAMAISAAKGAAFPTCRSLIANVVPPSDIGKIYSVTSTLEFMVPIGGAPLYTLVYNATIDTFPGAFNAITVLLYLSCYILFTILFGLQVRYPSITNSPLRRLESS